MLNNIKVASLTNQYTTSKGWKSFGNLISNLTLKVCLRYLALNL